MSRIQGFFVRFSADFKGDLWQDFKILTRFGDFIKDFVHFARDSVSYFVGFLVILNEDLEFQEFQNSWQDFGIFLKDFWERGADFWSNIPFEFDEKSRKYAHQ